MGHAEIIDPKAFYEAGFSGLALKQAECGMKYVFRSEKDIQERNRNRQTHLTSEVPCVKPMETTP